MEQRDFTTYLGFHPDIPRKFHIDNKIYFLSENQVFVPVQADIRLRAYIELMCKSPVTFVRESEKFICVLQQGNAEKTDILESFLSQALMNNASDLHLEPCRSGMKIKIRKDGFLYLLQNLNSIEQAQKLVSRAKVLASCDITESLLPQDGRFNFSFNGTEFNIRASFLPTPFGESAVLRFLKNSAPEFSYENTGIGPDEQKAIERAFAFPAGFYIVCGPTGSGKTTTAYALTEKFRNRSKKLVSVEEPVEYILEDAVQVSLNRKKGLSFASAVRSVMRHDPDMVFVGEIRDSETALAAVNFALTGHRVVTTVHASTPAEAVERIAAMGVRTEDLLLCTRMILAQRLVRKLCRECQGKGCKNCFQSGYSGRTGIFETVVFQNPEKSADNPDTKQIIKTATVRVMADDAKEKADCGVTDEREIEIVCGKHNNR